MDKDKVTEFVQDASKLPELCYDRLLTDNSIIVLKKGESGYYKTDFNTNGLTVEQVQDWVNTINSRMGITQEQVMALSILSMRR